MKKLVCITGPTASGKTSVAIQLALYYHTEILSFDSRQFYRELLLGTAPPSSDELKKVKHHFIHSRGLFNEYNASTYADDALKQITELFKTHDLLIMVGGSGLYLQAVLEGFSHVPPSDKTIRDALNLQFKNAGIETLQQELSQSDPIYYNRMDIHNPVRIMRALEVIRLTGKPYSEILRQKSERDLPFLPIIFMLNPPREVLYENINNRVDLMMKNGLLEEARALYKYRSLSALQTVGYKELFLYFEKQYTLEEAVDKIKQHTRHYAKRQLTWFRKLNPLLWPVSLANAIVLIDSYELEN
ncbi:MAG: tRNA (adenosine(37)-N6)-dimethylallyltransferase MiaA [Flavobacteriales bacterium]|nr:tRNA (adenosine(37)-N6)-dimethylallyltransferase MiaA [Flavobacteriales bacterium]